jgi:hypothetical protein
MIDATTVRASDAYLLPGKATKMFGYGYHLWLFPGNSTGPPARRLAQSPRWQHPAPLTPPHLGEAAGRRCLDRVGVDCRFVRWRADKCVATRSRRANCSDYHPHWFSVTDTAACLISTSGCAPALVSFLQCLQRDLSVSLGKIADYRQLCRHRSASTARALSLNHRRSHLHPENGAWCRSLNLHPVRPGCPAHAFARSLASTKPRHQLLS